METRSSETLTLQNIEQLRAFADPLRQRIFEALIEAPRTAKQVAESLAKNPTSLYHHFGVLEKAKLIRKVRTRQVRGTVEKYFQAIAPRILIDPALLGAAPLQALFASAFQATLDEIASQPRSDPDGALPLLHRLKIRATPERIQSLQAKLAEWIEDCQDADEDDAPNTYAITLAMYQVHTPSE